MYNEYFLYDEKDYEIFTERINEWKDRLIKKLLLENNNPDVYFSMKKSNMFDNIFTLLKDNIIDESDLIGFSEKLLNDLKEMVRIYNHNMYNK